MTKNEYLRELSRFADLDSAPAITSSGSAFVAKFTQNGEPVTLTLDKDGGAVSEVRGTHKKRYASYKGLLVSPSFGNLRRLAELQRSQIRLEASYIEDIARHLPILGELLDGNEVITGPDLFDRINSWLGLNSLGENVKALVIDGPAGIGKTHLIRRLVHKRATDYGPGSPPPILHVQSRGRRLTTLNDVLAGTLQGLRINLTFDQVPVLVRHGLLQVAIDGFDELADPDGYETAWGSLRDFIDELGGKGTIVLAGRDTFINVQSIKRSVVLLDSPNTCAVHLRTLRPAEARSWLDTLNWSESRIDALKEIGLLDDGSYALRPFFIRKIADFGASNKNFENFVQFPLRALVDAMLDREASLVKKSIPLKEKEIGRLFEEVLMEVARDMADSESDKVDDGSLDLIADLVFGKAAIDEERKMMLKHRVKSIALLEGDASSGQRKFPHTEIQDYFLGLAYVSLIANGEAAKSIRRGILGADFLDTFHDIAMASSESTMQSFYGGAKRLSEMRMGEDRSRRNMAALTLAALPSGFNDSSPIRGIYNESLDEAIVRGDAPEFNITSTDISQLDARGANLSELRIKDSSVRALIVDSITRLPVKFPTPSSVRVDGKEKLFLTSPDEIVHWIEGRSVSSAQGSARAGRHIVLLERVCRAILRQNWIRSNGDDPAARFMQLPEWDAISAILTRHQLLRVRKNVAVGGPKADFYRVERAREFLELDSTDEEIRAVRRAVEGLG